MKVLFDYQAFSKLQFGGVSNCFVKLIENLPDAVEYEVAVRESDNVHLRESSLKVHVDHRSIYEDNFISKHNFRGRRFLYDQTTKLFPCITSEGRNRLYSIEAIKKSDYDIFHPTFFHPYFLKFLKDKPFVVTVHDMIPELFFGKDDMQRRSKPLLCERATRIITVSHQTKNDLVDLLHIPDEKIDVIYHGAPEISSIKRKPIIDKNYILYVGQRGRYKCFMEMMSSLSPVLNSHKDIYIVCTGSQFTEEEILRLKDLCLYDRVINKWVNDEELYNLYMNALCFIYPSVYEGFGIPILEAYNAHCPVLLNHSSCFPEIAQDAAIYFHLDKDGSNLAEVVESFLGMSIEERRAILQKQDKRLACFSWKKSALQLLDVYNRAIDEYKRNRINSDKNL